MVAIVVQITSAHHFIAQLQASSTSSLHSNTKLEKEIEEVEQRQTCISCVPFHESWWLTLGF